MPVSKAGLTVRVLHSAFLVGARIRTKLRANPRNPVRLPKGGPCPAGWPICTQPRAGLIVRELLEPAAIQGRCAPPDPLNPCCSTCVPRLSESAVCHGGVTASPPILLVLLVFPSVAPQYPQAGFLTESGSERAPQHLPCPHARIHKNRLRASP